MSGASERANGRASGPVLTSLFLYVPDHSAAAPESTTIAIPPTPEVPDDATGAPDTMANDADEMAPNLALKTGRFPHQPRKLASAAKKKDGENHPETARPATASGENPASRENSSSLSRTASGRKRPLTADSPGPHSGNLLLLRPQDRERSDLSSPTLSILRNAVQADMSHIHSDAGGETTDESKAPSANVERKGAAGVEQAKENANVAPQMERERLRGAESVKSSADVNGVIVAVPAEKEEGT